MAMLHRTYLNLITACLLLIFTLPVAAAPVLVSTDWVAKHRHDRSLVLIDMSADDLQYARFHIEGAVRLPNRALLKYTKRKKYPVRLGDNEFKRLLGILGISRNTYVVIYDDTGGLEAGRLFWLLERIGHPRVSVMNGGLVKWILEGRKVVNIRVKPRPTRYQAQIQTRPNEATLGDVLKSSKTNSALLLDVRTSEEYIGDIRKRRGGHIPGARWWRWDQSLNLANGFILRDDKRLLASLGKVGITDKSQPVIAYCQSGHRAAQSYLVLRSLGFTRVRLYSNSMNEYGSVRTAPLKQGMQP